MSHSSRFARARSAAPALGILLASTAACSDRAPSTGAGGTGGGSRTTAIRCPTAPKVAGCTVAVAPSTDDYTAIQTALGDARPGDTVCLCPGSFVVDREVDIATERITIRGAGAAREDTVLDFAPLLKAGAPKAIEVTAGDFDIENLWVLDAPGDGIKVTGATGVTYRNLKASWSAGSSETNGAYALYPVQSRNVLIEDVEVEGAADAAVYVGQSTNAIVRRAKVHGSVAGIESENTNDMEIYDNDVFDNSAGVLVFALPQLTKKDAHRTHVHHNRIHDNTHVNFGAHGSVVSHVPVGVGLMLLACDDAEIHDNTIENQPSGGVVVVAGTTLTLLDPAERYDDGTDPIPTGLFIHDNTFGDCGANPASPLDLIPVRPLEDVIWDGEGKRRGRTQICLGTSNLPSFRDVNGILNIDQLPRQSTSTTPHECALPPLAPITF